jgi:thiol-disulfide isomerase/thioredoxin
VQEAFVKRRSLYSLANVLAPILLAGISSAQSQQILPGCEPPPEILQIIHEKLNNENLDKLKYHGQVELRRAVYEDLIAKYPREVMPYKSLIDMTRDESNAPAQLQERFRKLAANHPDDPLALYVSGYALFGTDTPESLHQLEAAQSKAPQFPAPPLFLASAYSAGKRMDKKKSLQNLAAYFALCPASANLSAQQLLAEDEDSALRQKVDSALRARLAKETDPKRLRDYAVLWNLEFHMHPTQEHPLVRRQIAEDLKRLESINPKPDSEWAAFLISGYKEADFPKETIVARQDSLLRDFPHSMEAYDIVSDRWEAINKKPTDQKDAAAWANYYAAREAVMKSWLHDFPELISAEEWFYTVMSDDSLSEKDGLAALDAYLQYETNQRSPKVGAPYQSGNFLLDHSWQPNRALDFFEQAKAESDKDRALETMDDNLTPNDARDFQQQDLNWDILLDGEILKAAVLAGRPEAVAAIKPLVEGPAPAQEEFLSNYWANRARLAVLEGRKEDALAYYQSALQARTETSLYLHGKLRDDIGAEARALWKEMGGTMAAWDIWSRPLPSSGPNQGSWEKANKSLPAFELSDFSGKTWRLRELNGKTLLINVWATWCGPCNAELPSVQNLYEQLKDRPDIQLLSFNVDDDLGLVAPFLKEKGYTFPVVPAHSLVHNLLEDNVGIPQNWVVDAKGNWRWTQMGFAEQDDWGNQMLQKLESANASN